MVIYVGVFIDSSDILVKKAVPLARKISNMHVTFAFKPDEETIKEFERLKGTPVTMRVVAEGHDSNNSGFAVELPDEVKYLYKNEARPHVTVFVSEQGKPIDTGKLDFVPIDEFDITGKIGLFYGGE